MLGWFPQQKIRVAITILVGVMAMSIEARAADSGRPVQVGDWSELPPIPDPLGVAGPYAGVAGEALVVAGGANFRDGIRPWKGGVKTWHDAVYLLDRPSGRWTACRTRLPRPMGYGVALTTGEGVWCIGGCDREKHFADAFVLRRQGDDVEVVPQPALPLPLAYCAGAVVGSKIVIAGGTQSPTAVQSESHVFVLDTALPAAARQWKTLASWPGPPRMLATAGAVDGKFYLFGGVQLTADTSGAPLRITPYLSDAYVLDLDSSSWTRLADLPAPRAACPTPAPLIHSHTLALFSGDDSSLTPAMEDRHTGFPATVLAFDTRAGRWNADGKMPHEDGSDPAHQPAECRWPPVTTVTVDWQGQIVIPSGEIRPGVRTRRVLMLSSSASP